MPVLIGALVLEHPHRPDVAGGVGGDGIEAVSVGTRARAVVIGQLAASSEPEPAFIRG